MVKVTEIVQCGDESLLKFACPGCGAKSFLAYPLSNCPVCIADLSQLPLHLPSGRKLRLLAGTKRKKKPASAKDLKMLYGIQGEACAYCEKPLHHAYHVEHIKPVACGGTNNLSNLVLACAPCNLRAGSTYFSSFLAKKLHLLSRA